MTEHTTLVADEGKKLNKKKLQLSWEDIHITAMPAQGKCCKGTSVLKEPKKIIDGVSGAVLPGQFLAIIGASGKFASLFNSFRCWKDHAA